MTNAVVKMEDDDNKYCCEGIIRDIENFKKDVDEYQKVFKNIRTKITNDRDLKRRMDKLREG